MAIGTNIKRFLAERKMTIKDLSIESGVPINTLYSITKRDSQNINSSVLTAISLALDVSAFDLTHDTFELSKEVEGYESFKNYLKSIGYSLKEFPVKHDGEECEFVVSKENIEATFTENEFAELQEITQSGLEDKIFRKAHTIKNKPST